MRPHEGVGVQVDPKITDRGCRLNKVGAYSDRNSWDLIADAYWTCTRGPRSCWRSTGAGYPRPPSTMPPRRHTQIHAPGTAMPLMDGRSRISACHQHTDVGRVDICRPTATSPPYTARRGFSPRTDPCGTPHKRTVTVEEAVPRWTYCVRLSRYE